MFVDFFVEQVEIEFDLIFGFERDINDHVQLIDYEIKLFRLFDSEVHDFSHDFIPAFLVQQAERVRDIQYILFDCFGFHLDFVVTITLSLHIAIMKFNAQNEIEIFSNRIVVLVVELHCVKCQS